MKYFFTIFFAASFLLHSNAQSNIAPEQAIKDLKNDAVLIVNLITPTKKIEALLKKGDKEASLKLTEETKKQNQRIVDAFAKHYKFGKVLFLQSYDMESFLDGEASALFSAQGNAQSALPTHFYYVELTETVHRNLNGFVVKDQMRDPIKKPFPYFISQYTFLRLKQKSVDEMVKELNEKFEAFYSRI